MNRKTIVTVCFATFAVLIAACAKKDETPQPTTGQPPGTMVNSGQPQPYGTAYPQQQPPPGYQQPPAGGGYQPAPTPAPGPTPAPAAGGGLATPNAMALPCQNDSACGLAHCNTQYGKCAFPCQTQNDCIQGAQCNNMTGFCIPGAPPAH